MLQLEGSRLLIVDDEPRNTKLLADIFNIQGCDVFPVNQSSLVVDSLISYEPDLIILDVMMPGKTGFELAREIKANPKWEHIPIILLTALADRDSCIAGLECGAEDYVSKPFSRRELSARVNSLLKLKKLHDFQLQNIRLLKTYDSITGLPKREMLLEFANALLKDNKTSDITVVICEVEIGQSLLGLFSDQDQDIIEQLVSRGVIERISSIFPPGFLLGCLGAGKFGLVLEAEEREAELLTRLLKHKLTQPFTIQQREFFLKFSLGYTSPPHQSLDWRILFNKAEMALLVAKRDGGSLIKKFEPEMDVENYEHWWLSQALHQAVREQQFEVYYQPQVLIKNGSIDAFEALMRWNHPEKGFISPTKFIPLAEENGLIYHLSLWMVEEVCKQIVEWKSSGHSVRVAINISAVQLHREEFTTDFLELFGRYNLTPDDFELELTESSLMDPKSGGQLQELWEKGFDIAIDDFGTGYSSRSGARSPSGGKRCC